MLPETVSEINPAKEITNSDRRERATYLQLRGNYSNSRISGRLVLTSTHIMKHTVHMICSLLLSIICALVSRQHAAD